MIKLHHAPLSSCSQKVRFVLEEKGLKWSSVNVDLHAGENLQAHFLALNPKGVVPVLEDGSDIIVESNNICLYLDEAYPQTPLMPASAKGRSDVRVLLQAIDEFVHSDSSALTYAIAFRDRLCKTYNTPEKVEEYLASIPDLGRRNFRRQMIEKGFESLEAQIAVGRLRGLINKLDGLLQTHMFVVSNTLSIADIALSPYLTRLSHLNLDVFWEDRPAVDAWYRRLQTCSGYQKGIADFFEPEPIARMGEAGAKYRDQAKAMLGS